MVACSSILAGVIPRTEEPGVIVDRVAKSWTRHSTHIHRVLEVAKI